MTRLIPLMFIALLGMGQMALAQSADHLRCAAGFGCQGLGVDADDALVLLGVETQDQATDLYIQKYPDRYFEDAFPEPGEPENPAQLDKGGEDSAIQLFDGDEAPTKEIDLFDGSETGQKEIDLFEPDQTAASGDHPVEFTNLEGYSEKPCAGWLIKNPKFPHAQAAGVSVCLDQKGFSSENCGLPAANPICVIQRKSKAACFGLTTTSRAVNIAAVCQGQCTAFSYIVCR